MDDSLSEIAVLGQIVATLHLAGLTWCFQIVHYPLMNRIEPRKTRRMRPAHCRTIQRWNTVGQSRAFARWRTDAGGP
jgi:hypothetical protein